jgi:glyoxylase-like metal-dependent hydrolase (beta-lactamase superfamily II)
VIKSFIIYLSKEDNDDDDYSTLIDPSFFFTTTNTGGLFIQCRLHIRNVKHIILTHLHYGHAQAANELKSKTGAKINAMDSRVLSFIF